MSKQAADRPIARKTTIRCAVYTRKSSEEGLEQDFNSLHAQREACEAYIRSQKHEGWVVLPGLYDDGGISGATMERPALKRLLADIEAGKVDTVVVYKVDRLTRTLSDFAKIVEVFDVHQASFVSVTQQFNTTTSMGRLTLNMLLSFAQFEREVTGERIRDKIAASKKKGMWMGGFVPLGYQAHDRTLVIDREEAETVRALYRLYLELGTVAEVKEKADLLQLRTKLRSGADGRMAGGRPFSRGHLYKLLANPIYRGKIAHKGAIYDGQHAAIIDPETWEAVQARLAENTHIRRSRNGAKAPSLLAGKLYDAANTLLAPTHAVKNGKRYRYYVSRDLIQNAGDPKQQVWRMPAHEIEALVVRALQKFLADEAALFDQLALDQSRPDMIKRAFTDARQIELALVSGGAAERHAIVRDFVARVEVADVEVRITIDVAALWRKLGHVDPKTQGSDQLKYTLSVPATLKQCGHGGKLIVGAADWQRPEQDPALINNIERAHRWLGMLLRGEAKSMRDLARLENLTHAYVRRLVPLAFLAPDITQAILAGGQPPELTAERLTRLPNLPLRWDHQRALLGFDQD